MPWPDWQARHDAHRQPRDRRTIDPATGVNAGPPSDRDGAGDAPDEAKGPYTPAPVAVSCECYVTPPETWLEMARKVEQAERRAEDAEAEVERLRSLLAKVQRVFDLQCPPMLPSKYDDRGAWMAHAWWDKVLGPVLQQVTACEWCAQQDGHANGCRLGRGPDEGECEHHWLDRPESDSRECLICGEEVFGG